MNSRVVLLMQGSKDQNKQRQGGRGTEQPEKEGQGTEQPDQGRKRNQRSRHEGGADLQAPTPARPPAPAPVFPCLPSPLLGHRKLSFEPLAYGLEAAAVALLCRTHVAGSFGMATARQGRPLRLEDFEVAPGVFRSFKARQALYNAVASDEGGILPVYERLVAEVCCPALKRDLVCSTPSASPSAPVRFWYQYPPTMRLQSGPSSEFGRTHADVEYGHQIGEVNFWLPLTDTRRSGTTLLAETRPGLGDFQEVPAAQLGEVAAFHGALCRHYAPPNNTPLTRCSLDFRIGIEGFFDPTWRAPGVPRSHGWRLLEL